MDQINDFERFLADKNRNSTSQSSRKIPPSRIITKSPLKISHSRK